ncbi:DUF4907 domain-containing protein [Puia sp. P3]|uniref:DUF4907 domain-containing protein n=1 Tax=Puia sp. P3 TaxID=3423952 RepID=UPI003D6664E5
MASLREKYKGSIFIVPFCRSKIEENEFLSHRCLFFFLSMHTPGIGEASNPAPCADNMSAVFDSVAHLRISYKLITNTDHSYGYDVFINGVLKIHQPVIPGMMGTRGFSRKADAKKVASLAIKKIQNGFMPPTIGRRELDSLRIKL